MQIKVWSIPDGGLTENLSDTINELNGHKRKVMHIEWHPTASDVLISAGFDHLVIFIIITFLRFYVFYLFLFLF